MTDIRTLDTIATELDQAREDIALMQRLNSAPERLKALTGEHTKAKIVHDKAVAAEIKRQADEARAAHDAHFAGLADPSITEVADPKSPCVLSSRFTIRFKRDAWDMDAGATVQQPVAVTSFLALAPNVLAWIVERHPDKMPASIMALAPGEPEEALDRYFIGLRRGYLTV